MEAFLERTVKPFGTSAKVDIPINILGTDFMVATNTIVE